MYDNLLSGDSFERQEPIARPDGWETQLSMRARLANIIGFDNFVGAKWKIRLRLPVGRCIRGVIDVYWCPCKRRYTYLVW